MKKVVPFVTVLLALIAVATALTAQNGQPGTFEFVFAPSGNEARYLVREQLANISFPNDAIGRTSNVTGRIVFDRHGRIVAAQSKIVVDITNLKSDQERRDRYIQTRTLHTSQYPKVELVPKEVRGLTFPLPASEPVGFELVGDLTVHGVTKPTTWQVRLSPKQGGYAGTASTKFTFDDFGLTKPRVAIVLSVADEIRLECDFLMIPQTNPSAR